MRTGAHNAHLSEQYVDELGELVDVGLAHYIAPLGLSRVVLRCLERVSLVVHLHASELKAIEFLAVYAAAQLLEENRTGHCELGDYAHHNEYYGKKGHQKHQRETQVEQPFHHTVAHLAQRLAVKTEIRHAPEHVEKHAVVQIVGHVRHAVEMHQMSYTIIDDGQNLVFAHRGKAAIHLLYVAVLPQKIGHRRRLSYILALFGKPVIRLVVKISGYLIAFVW